MPRKIVDSQPKVHFDCSKCPAYCCSVYERVNVGARDIARLAKHFGLTVEQARRRHTKLHNGERVLRRSPDPIFGEACKFLNRDTRGCTIYHARPRVCREYPDRKRCAYFDLLQYERRQQDDPDVLPLVKITFLESVDESDDDESGEIEWEWSPEG